MGDTVNFRAIQQLEALFEFLNVKVGFFVPIRLDDI